MIEQAYLLATIPFTVENTNPFGDAFMQNAAGEGWRKDQEQGNFLLKHINTTLAKNTVCFTKSCLNTALIFLCPLRQHGLYAGRLLVTQKNLIFKN